MGFGYSFWPADRGLVRPAHDLALDLLHQFPLLRDWFPDRTLGHEASCEPCFCEGSTPTLCGLDWRLPLRLKHLQLLDWGNMGWRAISVDELANTSPYDCWIG